ncbi:biotin-dependent carboxyltransferase family protein [Devosia sp.]|uniref:5-oxoprolinase subunit C family protein n=1 Tax=Devosia sp. TaxID=1871048 RepID=UPI003A957D57
MTVVRINRAGPLATIQDAGRPGMLRYGISASGPMDGAGFARAGRWLGGAAAGGIEFTTAGLDFAVEGGGLAIAGDGGDFAIAINGKARRWPLRAALKAGDVLQITPGRWGNFGYLRFNRTLELTPVMESLATNSIAAIGGVDGRALQAGDVLSLGAKLKRGSVTRPEPYLPDAGPLRIVWGLHADLFAAETRQRFVTEAFRVSSRIDRMGFRLDDPNGVFADTRLLSLVSDAVLPGDVQILGDGAPSVLMRDHQPTGGYPRIASVTSVDLDRLAQCRPGTELRFTPVTVQHAQRLKTTP